MKEGKSIHYMVHPTPRRSKDEVQTYHVRQVLKTTIGTHELAEHIAQHGLINVGLFEMVMERLKEEIREQLLSGHSLHLNGIGRFSLQLGTKRRQGDDGLWHTKTYQSPDELTAHEVVIEGITFAPDKAMLRQLSGEPVRFVRHKGAYEQDIPRAQLLTTLADYCEVYGSFSRQDFQRLFGVSRYRAQLLLDALVAGPDSQYYREKFGTSYVYRKGQARKA